MSHQRIAAYLILVCTVPFLLLTGCSNNLRVEPIPAHTGLAGAIHGGQQPITGASIQLYAVGTSGDGSAATPLLTTPVTSDSNGNFNLTGDYTCPSSTALVYLAGTGGSPSPGTVNPQIALMAALGACGTLTSSTFISMNEVTTVAAVYALSPYITSPSAIGSGSSDAAALTTAFAGAGYIASTSTGTAPGQALANYTAPVAQIDTIADLLAACINSSGGTSGDGSSCGSFFALTLPSAATPPTNALNALLNLALNPSLNTTALYDMVPPTAPFQPFQSQTPPDFAIRFVAMSLFTVAPSAISFPSAVVNFSQPVQTVTVTNGTAGGVNITSTSITGTNASDFAIVPTPATDCAITVPAGTTCSFQISFTPTAAGARSAYLILNNTSANPVLSVALSGSGMAPAAGPVTLSPSSLNFTMLNVPQTLTLTNSGTGPLTINSIQTPSGYFALTNNCGTSLAASASCSINVSVSNVLAPGATTLTVVDDAAAGPQVAGLSFSGTGIPTAPSTVDFGGWALGTTGDSPFEIVGPGISGSYNLSIGGANAADFSFSSTSSVASSSCSYNYRYSTHCYVNVYFKPSVAGAETAYMDLVGFARINLTGTGDPAGRDFDLFGYPPSGNSFEYAGHLTTLSFTSSAIGVTSTGSTAIDAMNTGSVSPLTLAAPTLSGANASDFTIGTGSCPGYSNCLASENISFKPSATGTRTATLTWSDSTSAITRTVQLTGVGTTPVPTFSTTALIFSNTPVGTVSAAQALTVTAYNGNPVSAVLSGPFVFTQGSSCAATPCQLMIAYAPTAASGNGPTSGTLTATDTLGMVSASTSFTGQVAPYPYFTLTPSTLTFSAQAVNTSSAPQTVTVTNSGTAALAIGATVQAIGNSHDYAVGNSCPAQLAVGATCTLTITFTPLKTGSRDTNAVVTSQGATTQYVQLLGTGT